ncbi:hypothetical protein C3747_32g246c [Trypanosoma cruzi]|uniref:Uncharacterized protein n=2 Tax=Trypanosoma cruzi TaxID=5693 RepID=Q4DNH1_TRYCC|nr:hypothetical protein, conserved [Trypanosoma cruzi]EAN94079.1 hypothetical protein, conserved [Trypanosoma cruzi]PWV14935.1 hypothetical protein C3747_32g246c [Trypanosoma cruzi]RNC46852.1 hypothetical protein TcCL_NonESM03344 [Trypanosoma cruzi]|eukprot:XP_815930.1 hypothetical protein [Trypanosoma cruzi strain CL Brener]
MPNVIVNCTFNPPAFSITGTQLRQETLDSLEKALPQCTTTSQNSMGAANGNAPKFMLVNSQPNTWRMSIGQHYCDQRGRCVVFSTIISTLQTEGWALRTTDSHESDNGKDITRLFFWRSG